jgi:thioredoxin reductase
MRGGGLFLHQRKKSDSDGNPSRHCPPHRRPFRTLFRERIRDQTVEIRTSSKVKRISKNEFSIKQKGEEKIVGPIDSVIIAVGYKVQSDLIGAFQRLSQGGDPLRRGETS